MTIFAFNSGGRWHRWREVRAGPMPRCLKKDWLFADQRPPFRRLRPPNGHVRSPRRALGSCSPWARPSLATTYFGHDPLWPTVSPDFGHSQFWAFPRLRRGRDGGQFQFRFRVGERGREGGGRGSSQGWGPEGWGARNFALFLPSPAPIFAQVLSLGVFSCLFFSLLGSSRVLFSLSGVSCVFSWNFGGV